MDLQRAVELQTEWRALNDLERTVLERRLAVVRELSDALAVAELTGDLGRTMDLVRCVQDRPSRPVDGTPEPWQPDPESWRGDM